MSSNAVALTPADQAAQYLKCGTAELAELIKARGGKLRRIGGDTYCSWDDVNALREARQPADTPSASAASRTGRQRPLGRLAQRSRTSSAQPPAKAKGTTPAKAASPATVDRNRGKAPSKAPGKGKPWPNHNPEAEIAELVKLPKQDLLDAAIAFGMAPPYPYHRRPIAEYIVNAKAAMRTAGKVAPGQAGKDELSKRRQARRSTSGRKVSADPAPMAFSHGGK